MNTINFQVSVKGDYSNELYSGTFTMKTRLSYRETLKQDQIRRDLLGPDAANTASEDAKGIAQVLSFLGVYITQSPRWWTDCSNGLDSLENNLVSEVYSAAIKALSESIDEKNKRAEEAKAALAKVE